tara:strand:+ start:126 stop:893 length:768 start_codon:yes stop_codon:yes gene_type:complete
MSIKSFLQIIIVCLIGLIVSVVYLKYFKTVNNIVEEVDLPENNLVNETEELKNKIIELELKNNELKDKIKNNINKQEETIKIEEKNQNEKKNSKKEIKDKETIKKDIVKKEVKNLVKDVEYISVDQKGNRFYLLANSGKTNKNNKNVLDLENVRGEITSDKRATIYIKSDFAHYNSKNLNSKFYENVIINYEDKKITCLNFDINMETNKAIAYNKVIVTDPKSIMKAGIVEFDLKTKDININPDKTVTAIGIVTN